MKPMELLRRRIDQLTMQSYHAKLARRSQGMVLHAKYMYEKYKTPYWNLQYNEAADFCDFVMDEKPTSFSSNSALAITVLLATRAFCRGRFHMASYGKHMQGHFIEFKTLDEVKAWIFKTMEAGKEKNLLDSDVMEAVTTLLTSPKPVYTKKLPAEPPAISA